MSYVNISGRAEMAAASSANSTSRGYVGLANQWDMNNLLAAEVECGGPAWKMKGERPLWPSQVEKTLLEAM